MAEGNGGRSLQETPTWAVAVVCFVLIAISIVIEHIIHLIEKWLKRKHKRALHESLEKIKAELMLLGFISLLLTVSQGPISNICIPKSLADSWHPCNKHKDNDHSTESNYNEEEHRRKLLLFTTTRGSFRRVLAGGEKNKCSGQNQVPFVSTDGIHQLHIFIFVLALSHVLYCVLTMALSRAKMRSWKAWEKETKTIEYQYSNDPERFRFARETSFGRRHLNFWTKNRFLIWIVCFFRQFVRSVPKVDYLTLRHGFIFTHLASQSHAHFDFQKYINRSLEEDFKTVVGISPIIWFFAVLFVLSTTNGLHTYLWLPFIPLIIILVVGTKLQVIITKMGLKIMEKGEVVRGVPVVELGDDLFWFNRPRLILFLITFVLFQNAFQLAFLAWASMQFGVKSCYNDNIEDVVIRITMGVLIQILCSYVTLPLYALVTQMGSTMKPTIFNDRVATALKNWHHTAKRNIKVNHQSGSTTPFSSFLRTRSHNTSPVHLLRHYKSNVNDSLQNSPRKSIVQADQWDTDSSYPSYHKSSDESLSHHHRIELSYYTEDGQEPGPSRVAPFPKIDVDIQDFSFDRIGSAR